MIVVSNTSPILNLTVPYYEGLLRDLYSEVLIPDAVASELRAIQAELQGASDALPPWMRTQSVASAPLVRVLHSELDLGESEAIVLALDTQADLLLLDERKARAVAARLGVRFIGLLGVLLEAKRRGHIPSVKPLLDSVIVKAGFWLGSQLYSRVLREAGE